MRVRGDAPHDDLCPSNDGSPGPVDCDFCERLYSADARGYTRGWSAGHVEGQRDERERIRTGVTGLVGEETVFGFNVVSTEQVMSAIDALRGAE